MDQQYGFTDNDFREYFHTIQNLDLSQNNLREKTVIIDQRIVQRRNIISEYMILNMKNQMYTMSVIML